MQNTIDTQDQDKIRKDLNITDVKDDQGNEFPSTDGATPYLGNVALDAAIQTLPVTAFNLLLFGELTAPEDRPENYLHDSVRRIFTMGYGELLALVLADKEIAITAKQIGVYHKDTSYADRVFRLAGIIIHALGGHSGIERALDYKNRRQQEASRKNMDSVLKSFIDTLTGDATEEPEEPTVQ